MSGLYEAHYRRAEPAGPSCGTCGHGDGGLPAELLVWCALHDEYVGDGNVCDDHPALDVTARLAAWGCGDAATGA